MKPKVLILIGLLFAAGLFTVPMLQRAAADNDRGRERNASVVILGYVTTVVPVNPYGGNETGLEIKWTSPGGVFPNGTPLGAAMTALAREGYRLENGHAPYGHYVMVR